MTCGNISSGSGARFKSYLYAATDFVLNQELCRGFGRNGITHAPITRKDRHNMPLILRSSVSKTLATAQDLALQTLTKNRDLLEFITQTPLDERVLDKNQIAMLFGNVPPARNSHFKQGMYQKY